MTHPAIRDLFQSAAKQPAFQLLLQQLTRGETGPYNISGLVTTAKALYLVLLYQATDHPVLVIVDGSKEAEELLEATQTFFKLLIDDRQLPDPQLLPAHDVLPSQKLSPHNEIAEARAVALWRLSTQKVPITVVPVASALYRTESSDFYRQLALTVKVGDELPLEDLLQHLESIGYERREPVEMEGEYSLRGGILDVFPAEAAQPVRIEFFGDEVESARRFDVETQRSILKLNTVQLLPLVEHPRSRPLFRQLAEAIGEESGDDLLNPGDPFPGWEYLVPLARPRSETVFSLCPNALVVLDEPEAIHSATERLWVRLREPARIEPEQNFGAWEEIQASLSPRTVLNLRQLEVTSGLSPAAQDHHIPTRPALTFKGNMPVAVAEARNLIHEGHRVAFFAKSTGELERLGDVLQEYSVPYQLGIECGGRLARPYGGEPISRARWRVPI